MNRRELTADWWLVQAQDVTSAIADVRALGYTDEETAGDHARDFVAPDGATTFRLQWRAAPSRTGIVLDPAVCAEPEGRFLYLAIRGALCLWSHPPLRTLAAGWAAGLDWLRVERLARTPGCADIAWLGAAVGEAPLVVPRRIAVLAGGIRARGSRRPTYREIVRFWTFVRGRRGLTSALTPRALARVARDRLAKLGRGLGVTERVDLARFRGAPPDAVERMLRLAHVGPGDTLYDVGSGDGRIVIAAARRGARAVGIELNRALVERGRQRAHEAGVTDRATFRCEDARTANFADATVVTLYLQRVANLLLRPTLRARLRPGTRLVSLNFDMGDWPPVRTVCFHETEWGGNRIHEWRL